MADGELIPVPAEVSQQFIDNYTSLVHSTAAYWGRQYRHCVDIDDVAAELWVYLFRRWEWVLDLIEERGEKRAGGKLKMRLTDVARGFCMDEHNARNGIQRDDLAWYDPSTVAEILGAALDLDRWVKGSPEKDSEERRAPSRPSEHGTRLAMLADVAHAFTKLDAEDQYALRAHYAEGHSYQVVANDLDIGLEAAKKRCERALTKLVKKLGGRPPVWPAGRKAVSNSAAQARTRKAYEQ
jgi:RNA polymerase sigma factor (sigma-70 family)